MHSYPLTTLLFICKFTKPRHTLSSQSEEKAVFFYSPRQKSEIDVSYAGFLQRISCL